jgi:hypothetical protein
MPTPIQVHTLICRQVSRTASPAVRALTDEILLRYGSSAQAVLFYGSCLHTGDPYEGIIDLYLLVDDYRLAYRRRLYAILNKLLPPNVFYLEFPFEGRIVRTKYAVLSLADFQRGTSMRWFQSYLWARFAQPAALIYARDDHVAERVQAALTQAVLTFVTRVLPQVAPRITARDLWCKGLLLSYRAELRPERLDKLGRLFDAESEYYEQLTGAALAEVPFPVEIIRGTAPIRYHARIPTRVRVHSRLAWRIRRLQGKSLSVLRILKSLFTFQGWLDYGLWKIEQHSGIAIEVTPRLRRHPLLAACLLFWRAYRRGAFQ